MKFAAVTLLLATLALANPAPAAEPEAAAAPAPVAAPVQIDTRAALDEVLAARAASPQLDARSAGLKLAAREPKKSKPKTSSGNGNDTEDAAVSLTPSRALQLGALGLGVMEVVRLWG
jgi:hypothetical protein